MKTNLGKNFEQGSQVLVSRAFVNPITKRKLSLAVLKVKIALTHHSKLNEFDTVWKVKFRKGCNANIL